MSFRGQVLPCGWWTYSSKTLEDEASSQNLEVQRFLVPKFGQSLDSLPKHWKSWVVTQISHEDWGRAFDCFAASETSLSQLLSKVDDRPLVAGAVFR